MMRRHGCWQGFEGMSESRMAGSWGKRGRGGFGSGFGPGWGDWGGGHGHRGKRRMFDSGELRLVLLKLIADEPRHGYDAMRAIEEMTGGSYAPSPGVVYPTLTMLLDMGLIEEAEGSGSRKIFSATAEGRAHLEQNASEVQALFERLTEAGEPRRRAEGAPIKRAVANLLAALWNRVTQEDMDSEQLHRIAAILDEAAQKIERPD